MILTKLALRVIDQINLFLTCVTFPQVCRLYDRRGTKQMVRNRLIRLNEHYR